MTAIAGDLGDDVSLPDEPLEGVSQLSSKMRRKALLDIFLGRVPAADVPVTVELLQNRSLYGVQTGFRSPSLVICHR